MRYHRAAILLLASVALPLLAADDPKPKKDADKNPAAVGADKKADAGKADAKKADDKKADPKKDGAAKPDARPGANPRPQPGAATAPAPFGRPAPRPRGDAGLSSNNEKNVRAGIVTGKITAVMEDKKAIRIQVTMHVPQVNQGALQSMAQAQINLAQANSPQAVLQAQQQMLQAQLQLVQVQNVEKEYELEASEELKVRLAKPPEQFDEKGRIKKYTKAELKELKGNDPRLPGYNGEFSDLRQDQVVEVTLVHKKDLPRRRPGRPMGKDAEVDLLTENLPKMAQIMVIYEPKHQ